MLELSEAGMFERVTAASQGVAACYARLRPCLPSPLLLRCCMLRCCSMRHCDTETAPLASQHDRTSGWAIHGRSLQCAHSLLGFAARYFSAGAAVFTFSKFKLARGIAETFATRRRVLHATSVSLATFMTYWTAVLCLLAVLWVCSSYRSLWFHFRIRRGSSDSEIDNVTA